MFRLELTTTELEQLTETAINESNLGLSKPPPTGITETPLIRRAATNLLKTGSGFSSSTPIIIEDQLNRMKQEFNRCVADQKLKRQEIIALKEKLAEKDREIDALKADENRALIEITINKEKADRLANRLKSIERELDQVKENTAPNAHEQSTPSKHVEELHDKLHRLEKENDNFRINCDHLNETIKELEDERDKIEEKYREACLDIAQLQGKLTMIESQPCLNCEKEKFLAKDSHQECIRLKELYLNVHEEKEEVTRKLKQIETLDVNKELMEQRNMVASLERTLQLTEMKCNELTKILDREKIDYEHQIQNLRSKYEQGKLKKLREMSKVDKMIRSLVYFLCRKITCGVKGAKGLFEFV